MAKVNVTIFTTTNEYFTETVDSKLEAINLSDRVVKYGYLFEETVFPPAEIKCVFWRGDE